MPSDEVTHGEAVSSRFWDAQAAQGIGDVYNYIVSGDSTRHNDFNDMINQYEIQLAKIGMTVYSNATSGQSAEDWLNNVSGATLQEAIDNTPNTGLNTILEYSFGINDQASTDLEIEGFIADGITAYLLARPDAIVLLVSPPYLSVVGSRLDVIYQSVSSSLSLPLLLGTIPMSTVHGDSDYYQDVTHPNKNGSKRLLNYILSEYLPDKCRIACSIENAPIAISPITSLVATVESNLWSNSTGLSQTSPTWRRLQPITVEPNFVLHVTHQGNRTDVSFMDDVGDFIITTTTTDSGSGYRTVTIPVNATEARLNVTSDGTAYDLLGDVPAVEYAPLGSETYLRQDEINKDISIALPIVNKFLLDGNGTKGSTGQVPTVQADGSWLWI